MKKKLIIAAAIAFAVFAIPSGSNALSTVSVASENNTVATPTPAVNVDKVVDDINDITITDEASAKNAVNTLTQQIGTANLKAAIEQAMVPGNPVNTVSDALYDLEVEYANALGMSDIAGAVGPEDLDKNLRVAFTGATFNGATAVWTTIPEDKPAITNTNYNVTSSYYVDFQLIDKDDVLFGGKLDVPVIVYVEVPAGMNADKIVVFHFVDGKEVPIIPNAYYDERVGNDVISFVVDHFSTFALAEVESVANNTGACGTDNVFARYRENLASEIANAKDGTTIKITRDQDINALPNDIMKALYKKQTVALELEYTFQGKDYTVTIPAGKAEDNAIEWYGPLYLQMRYGK